MSAERKLVTLVLGGWLAMLAPGLARAGDVAELGMAYAEIPGAAGQLDSRGEVVADRGVVATRSERAIVQLDNGQVLRLDVNSSAVFEALSGGDEVKVTVLSGRVGKWSSRAKRMLTGGAGSWFIVDRSLDDPLLVEALLLRQDGPAGASAAGESGRRFVVPRRLRDD